MKNIKKVIILTYETGWEKPIQAKSILKIRGKIFTRRFFAHWDTFEEAIKWLNHGHSDYDIIVDRNITIGI